MSYTVVYENGKKITPTSEIIRRLSASSVFDFGKTKNYNNPTQPMTKQELEAEIAHHTTNNNTFGKRVEIGDIVR